MRKLITIGVGLFLAVTTFAADPPFVYKATHVNTITAPSNTVAAATLASVTNDVNSRADITFLNTNSVTTINVYTDSTKSNLVGVVAANGTFSPAALAPDQSGVNYYVMANSTNLVAPVNVIEHYGGTQGTSPKFAF
jgi:hypothetical protein